MRVFFLDLWLDLREKRLAPVAVLLVALIIAVPLVLANSNDSTTTTPPPATATTAASVAVVKTPSATPEDSKLQTFSARDPFEPSAKAVVATTTTTTSSSTSSSSNSSSDSGSSSSSSSGSTPTDTSQSGGGTTGSQPSTGTGTTTPPSGTGNTTGETKTTLFTYTVDLRFGQSDTVKSYKNVRRLELVPSSDNPKVVFLGVTTSGKTAVFLVDNNIGVDTAGGKCKPSPDECTFLYLRPDADHDLAQLTDSDGTVYHLRLLDINRVTVSSANGGSGNGSNSGNGNSTRPPAFTGRASDGNDSVPGDAPPGEPDKRSSFQQFFADGASSK